MGLKVEEAWQLNREWNAQAQYPDSSAFTLEIPRLTVYVDDFAIDKYEVTNAQYSRCVTAGICQALNRWSRLPENYSTDPQYDHYPVLGVRWLDANAYCHWVGKRLSTEAEWEKAARGTDGRKYPWGNTWDSQAANFTGDPELVGVYSQDVSPYGVMDMAGNAPEWTADQFQPYPGNPQSANLQYLQDPPQIVVRGGGAGFDQLHSMIIIRSPSFPDPIWPFGFRCVKGSAPTSLAAAVRATTILPTLQPLATVDLSQMAYVPAGDFIMGTDDERASDDVKPSHIVYLDAFYIDKYEVTIPDYVTFLNAMGPQRHWGCDGHDCALIQDNDGVALDGVALINGQYQVKPGYERMPVIDTGWHGANAYCHWVGKRLPTEAEWEKAARGTDGRKYPWGNEWDPERAVGSKGARQGDYPFPVGSYPGDVSPYGVFDMLGNAEEWVFDSYARAYYQHSPYANPQGPASSGNPVVRGISGRNAIEGVTRRITWSGLWTGFRCAYTPH